MKRQTFIEYSKTIVISLIITFVCAAFSLLQFLSEKSMKMAAVFSDNTKLVTVVIDAGHGGEDGGAVGLCGSLEKDINLAISNKVCDLFDLTDINVVMTRTTDEMLYENGQENRKKFHDLNNRVGICKGIENPVFISIHQNKFPIEKYCGLQVYYSPNNDFSKMLAQNIQGKTAEYIQKDNNRKIKEAGRNIFVLDKLSCPAVLVECGFLSNKAEEEMLNDEEYQKKIAYIVFSSVIDLLNDINV